MKLAVVLGKNLVLKGRHWIQTALEIVVPCLLFIALVVIRSALKVDTVNEDPGEPSQEYGSFLDDRSGMRMFCWSNGYGEGATLYVAPNSSKYAQIFVEQFNTAGYKYCQDHRWTNAEDYVVAELIESEEDIVEKYAEYVANENNFFKGRQNDDLKQSQVYGGIIFEPDQSFTSPHLNYKIRLGYQRTYYVETQTQYLFDPWLKYDYFSTSDAIYNYEEEVAIQSVIDLLYLQGRFREEIFIPVHTNFTDGKLKLSVSDQGIAIPSRSTNFLATILDYIMPIFAVISFMFVVPPLLKRIVQEKESGVKEFMKMMGLSGYMNWIAWFITAFVSCLITNLVILLLLGVNFSLGPVIQYTNVFIVFISLTLYSVALIFMLFAISTLFNNANLALVAGILLHLITFFFPYGVLSQNDQFYVSVSMGAKMGMCLLPNVGLWLTFKGVLGAESATSGFTFSEINEALIPGDNITMLYIWLMFLASSLIYGVIIWYVDTIKPGPFGQAKPIYFPFMKSYWFTRKGHEDYGKSIDMDDYSSVWEPEPEGRPGVKVVGLRKVFKKPGSAPFVAVNDVRFSAFPDQIMALLGHNGAGKTTTMSILTGLFSSSGGTAQINGLNIDTSMAKIRGDLGLCPQHNMLFASLTVREHLIFFGMLKGMSWKEARRESISVADRVMLSEKVTNMSTALSGGMKRKLHLGIALMGDSRVVLLDEPTSGMDPEARREIWDLLLDMKKDRTVILTTHFMEEADVLGDRIAIMAKGRVQCYGSSLFLKRAYGSGYRLTMTKGPDCDSSKVKNTIREHIPEAVTLSNVSGELAMSLPTESEEKFSDLLKRLTDMKSRLGIANFGLSVTTLEDVFLKVGSKTEDTETLNQAQGQQEKPVQRSASIESGHRKRTLPEKREDLVSGFKLWFLQMKGLITKRMIQTKRNWMMYLLMGLVPMIMAILSGVVVNLVSDLGGTSESEPRRMTFADYQEDNTVTLINRNFTSDYANRSYDVFMDYMSNFPKTKVVEVENFDNYIMKNADSQGMERYGRKYVLGFSTHEFNYDWHNDIIVTTELNAHFNVVPLHARPMAKNLLANMLNKMLVNPAASLDDIQVTYEPIVVENDWDRFWYGDVMFYPSVLVYSILLSVSWILFFGTFIIFPIRERLSQAKQVQIMAGVHPITFWLANLAWDFLITLVITVLVLVLLCVLDARNLFTEPEAWGGLAVVHVLYGLSALLTAYVFSFATKSAPAAFAFYVLVALVCGVVIPNGVWFMSLVDYEVLDETEYLSTNSSGPNLGLISDCLRYSIGLFSAMPMTRAIMAITQVSEENGRCMNNIPSDALNTLCRSFANNPSLLDPDNGWQINLNVASCCDERFVLNQTNAICNTNVTYENNYNEIVTYQTPPCPYQEPLFSFDRVKGINIDLLYLALDSVILLCLLYGLESGYLQRGYAQVYNWVCRSKPIYEPEPLLDQDVTDEQDQALKALQEPESAALIVNNLAKNFGKFRAVRGLSFTIKHGECFGFLGVNGAGKTTSFRMLTGDEYMTEGQSILYGQDLGSNRRKYLRQIGYCPQFDSIIDVLTGREILNLFAHIRGVPKRRMQEEVNKWIEFVGLMQYADRKCGQYSGGNKRKLNVAQALVGDPPIIFLDEPSTGVDPVARRKLWDAITSIKNRGQSVVLTSHSMEECEALCDRISIMVRGQFRCMGGPQHLKNKFGQGFTVIMKMNQSHPNYQSDESKSKIKGFMTQKFPSIVVKDEHKDYVHFHIPDVNTPWYVLFQSMQEAKVNFPFVQDYALNETSLEDVFLLFARGEGNKSNPDEGPMGASLGTVNEGFE
ncbi:phospholipid-transporting ATPase ABCA3-like [Tigriopus californicus]|uniref:phospholipid-transporting ATPase ABCA3-like n=1 Tax=Tigriopus californicus TaxID=6832 RepID=UPI0027D9E6E1|nr:phospholipid-transporting ATPase ABCA3-like [Tigriopus californicus]